MFLVLGLIVIAIGLCLVPVVIGMAIGNDDLAMWGFGGIVVIGIVSLILLGIFLAVGGIKPDPLVEGTCYRAVRHTTTMLIPIGKVLVPSTTSGIDLVEVHCP